MEKNENLDEEIETVRNGVYNVLQKNQGMHTKVIAKLLENKKDIDIISKQALIKKSEYDNYMKELELMFQIMNDAENKSMEKLNMIEKNDNNGLQSDISRVHQKSQINKELEHISAIKGEIVKTIFQVRSINRKMLCYQ